MLFAYVLAQFYLTLFFYSVSALPASNDDRSLKLPRILTAFNKSSSSSPSSPKSPSTSWMFHHQTRMVHHANEAENTQGRQKKYHDGKFRYHQEKLMIMHLDDANESLAKVERKQSARPPSTD